MQVTSFVLALVLVASGVARADDAAASVTKRDETKADDLELRLTLSSFLFRQAGAAADPLVATGAAVDNASPVRRYFGDLRVELGSRGLAVDARVRQTTSQRYQSGAAGGSEYELRTLSYTLGSVTLGRQVIDAVGATKIDGAGLTHRLATRWTATVFAGTFPELGSRSVTTDYAAIDGTGARLIPIAGGFGVSYRTPDYQGDLGAAAVYALQDVPGAEPADASRVFTTSNGYWRPAPWLDIYHFALLDVASAVGVNLTNGSLGIDARPRHDVKLHASVHHVSTDLLQINARNVLVDPDPTAMGIVQNDTAVIRVSSDTARAGTSVALARGRFEISLAGGLRRRPTVTLPLADGSGEIGFSAAKSVDTTLSILDRRSIGGLRISLAGTITTPVGDATASRARGTVVRFAASRSIADQRGQLEADLMAEKFRDLGGGMCVTSTTPLACFGTSTITAAQAGVMASWRIAREWLVLADTHAGYQDIRSSSPQGPVTWPHVYSLTVFGRVQWRYR